MAKRGLIVLVGFISTLSIILTSCSLAPKTGVDYSYYYPDWTPDGKIICIKKAEEWTETTPWPYGAPMRSVTATKYYITTMSEEGTQETNIKQIDRLGKVSASPKGNYIAYTNENYIKAISASGTDVSTINCGDEIDSLDWSPDEKNLVYSIFKSSMPTYEVYLVDRDGALKEIVANGLTVDWRYGTRIVFVNNGSIQLIDSISKQVTNLQIQGGFPQLSDDNQILYKYYNTSEGHNEIWTMTTSAESKIRKNEAFNDYWIPKWSPDKIKIVCGEGSESGLWVINIDGTGLTQLK